MTVLITVAAVTVALVAVAIAAGKILRGANERDEQRAEDTRRLIEELHRRRR